MTTDQQPEIDRLKAAFFRAKLELGSLRQELADVKREKRQYQERLRATNRKPKVQSSPEGDRAA